MPQAAYTGVAARSKLHRLCAGCAGTGIMLVGVWHRATALAEYAGTIVCVPGRCLVETGMALQTYMLA